MVKTFFIPSGSMEDTLLVGDHLFVNRFIFGAAATAGSSARCCRSATPRRGDIVIFRSPERPTVDLVKRCVGLPGDTMQIVNKQLFVNGERVDDAGVRRSTRTRGSSRTGHPRRAAPAARQLRAVSPVPAGHYFCMGDNRDHSYDSRFWGTVPDALPEGARLPHLLVVRRRHLGRHLARPGRQAAELARTAIGFVTETRWSRSFHLPR